ncbi:MAG: hypothetical protein AAF961_00895, partial [Planctomycetota bacterium]
GEDGARRRWQFFLPLFGRDDPKLQQLAYLELGRAPYDAIRKLGRLAPRNTYEPLLQDPKYLKWRSLAILLLAQSKDPVDQRRVRDAFTLATRLGMTTNLAAWTAALIELDGPAAVDSIEAAYCLNADPTSGEVAAMVEALSMHGGVAKGVLQDRIVASYRPLLKAYPRFAPRVAADLVAWKRSELVAELSTCLALGQGFDIAEKRIIRQYLHAAPAPEEATLVSD